MCIFSKVECPKTHVQWPYKKFYYAPCCVRNGLAGDAKCPAWLFDRAGNLMRCKRTAGQQTPWCSESHFDQCKECLDPEPCQPIFQSFYNANDVRIYKVRVDRLAVLVQAGMLKQRSFELEQELMRDTQNDLTAVTKSAHAMMASAEHSMAKYQELHAEQFDVLAKYSSPLATNFDVVYVPQFKPDGSPNPEAASASVLQLTHKVSELSVTEFDGQVELQRRIRDLENVNKSLSEKLTKLEHDFRLKSQAFDEAKAHAAHLKGLLARRDVEKADMTDLIVSYDPTYPLRLATHVPSSTMSMTRP
ncbi:hypothetical protein CYMTET_2962 [Cymbomonas tetramitiformis]|uniref:Uncharacterized protein n=1 Tax=Cymbomonas tetramitiformis TaxID=36881 RepID=A0AAE0H4C7_9CHLO|nr:hypothetical protein CYMTET_2962 [Cymbomonas tetramitiformis]